jgi:hypothetical protein
MKKREFLAMGGALPLMLVGCGSGTGSAPMRLVNASVGYPLLGFMDQSTPATTADVAYGATSPYINVEAGAVGLTLTVGGASATAAQIRTVSKDSRYSLVAFGFLNLLKSVLITESTVVPDAGQANVNVLNSSVDIGPVDVYLSTTPDLSVSTLIASGISGVSQSAFAGVLAGSYYVTVVGANSIAQGLNDQRFQTPGPIVLTALQVLTIILTPGASGVLANAIMLTQGTTGTAVSYLNTTARLRAVTSVGSMPASVGENVFPVSSVPNYSDYVVVTTGTPPLVTVSGASVSPTMTVSTTTGTGASAVTTSTVVPAVLAAGGDYTMLVYLDSASGQPAASMITDDNTAPVTAQGCKFRLINLASNNPTLSLSMAVNSIGVASLVPFATASKYKELTTPQTTNSVATVTYGTEALITITQIMQLPNIFTAIVTSVDLTATPNTAKSFFLAAAVS